MNGIPILNLRHLCHLLDRFTNPHISSSKDDASNAAANENSATVTSKNSTVTAATTSTKPEEMVAASVDNGYTSFKTIDGELSSTSNDIVVGNCSNDGNDKDGIDSSGDIRDAVEESVERNSLKLTEEEILYSRYTDTMENLYHRAGDDPLLLDCTNYVHFELDKDKVVVFKISSAYTKNSEILKQYSITASRSDNLPEQSY